MSRSLLSSSFVFYLFQTRTHSSVTKRVIGPSANVIQDPSSHTAARQKPPPLPNHPNSQGGKKNKEEEKPVFMVQFAKLGKGGGGGEWIAFRVECGIGSGTGFCVSGETRSGIAPPCFPPVDSSTVSRPPFHPNAEGGFQTVLYTHLTLPTILLV